MPIVEFDGLPSWSLDASETGESTKCLWVGVRGRRKHPQAFCTLHSFARIERLRWRPVKLNDRHLRFHGETGNCEQSISSWVIACFPGILLRSLSEEYVNKARFILFPFVVLILLLILFCHSSVYFVTRRHEKQIKCEQVSPQAATDFAKEKKALKTTRIIIMALLVCFLPRFVYILFSYANYNSSSYIVNVIILSHPVFVSFLSLNSLCNPIIYCYRNKMFRKTCKELLQMKCTNFNEE